MVPFLRRHKGPVYGSGEVADMTTAQMSKVADLAEGAVARKRKEFLATKPPDISDDIAAAESSVLRKRTPGANIDPVTGKRFIGRAGAPAASETPGMVSMKTGYAGTSSGEAIVPAAAGKGIIRRRMKAESPERAVGQIVKADPSILTEGLQGRASGAGLAHLFPKTYGGAATNPLRAAQEQDMADMRYSFKSPMLRREQDKREATIGRSGLLREKRAHELAIARAENPVAPQSATVTKLRTTTKGKGGIEDTYETTEARTAAGQRINPATDKPFTSEELQQERVDTAIYDAQASVEAAISGKHFGKYKDAKLPQAKADITRLIKTALPDMKRVPPGVVDVFLELMTKGEDPNELLAELAADSKIWGKSIPLSATAQP